MADTTNISWADMTFNPWIGCTRIAPACDGCYAAHLMETRMHRAEWGAPGKGNGTRVRTKTANWRKPLAWNARAAKDGTRPFVFCASLADVFDNAVPDEWRRDLFDLIRATPHLVWLLLTKRPQNIARMAEKAGGLPENAAIGTTVEDQPRANINVPALLQASVDLWRAETRPLFLFLSCEPLIGPVDVTAFKGIQWVIVGGETDQGEHKARPAHPEWIRGLRDQCEAAGVAFHFKQWGEYMPEIGSASAPDAPELRIIRAGKRHTGRLLDGTEHNARPAIPTLTQNIIAAA